MCGIFFSISASKPLEPSPRLLELLQQRGPDSTKKIHHSITTSNGNHFELLFISTVLALRGDNVVPQPFSKPGALSLLCWNGEAWQIAGQKPHGNDTAQVFALFEDRKKHHKLNVEDAERALFERLGSIAGPYAFVYFDAVSQIIYFGRDFLGRRSLLWSCTEAGELIISSICDSSTGEIWHELDADGVYSIALRQAGRQESTSVLDTGSLQVNKHALPSLGDGRMPYTSVRYDVNIGEIFITHHQPLSALSPCINLLQDHIQHALAQRILDIPVFDISGEIEKTRPRLAILFSGGLDCTLLARLAHDLIPIEQPIDLLNVAFENPRVHKNADILTLYELCPDRITGRASVTELQETCAGRLWRFVAIDVPYSETTAHREQVMTLMHPHNTEMDLSISYALYFASRGVGIASDYGTEQPYSYTTPARVLLSGLGADELFGGYTRHATAYRRAGRQGLLDELALDIGRLGKRNLGRDDRIISHWSKEVRFPYLDETFVAWVLRTPVEEKCGFSEQVDDSAAVSAHGEHLEAGKKALRCLAWKLGMQRVASEKKRAIQFGARTAKMETGKTKGTTLVQ